MKYLQSLIIRISSVFAMVIGCFCLAQTVSAATITVCASGCDSTTLAGAFASGFTPGDEISVGATYDPAGDASAFPLDLHFPFTIDCHHSGAVLGQTNPTGVNYSYLPANSTIQNCNIGNFVIYANSFHPENIQILNNNFSTTATSTINFYFGAHNFLIEGNTNINAFSIGSTATSTSGIIRNNTFYFHDIGNNDLFTIDQGAQVDHLVVASNTFESHTVGTRGSGDGTLIFMSGDSNSFVTNTVRFATAPSSTMKIAVSMKGSGATVFSGNIIDAPANSPASYCAAAQFGLQSDFSTLSLTILHNTLHLPAGCGYNIGLDITDNNIAGAISADIRYNLLYRDGPIHAGQDRGIIGDKNTGSSSFSISNDYNAIYHFSRLYDDTQQSTGASLGAHTYAAKPFLRTDNISTADDYELAPFSPYLDINGTEDIGAVTGGPRRANIHIDASGIVDYSTVDATSTREIGNSLRSGDTLTLQSGVYAPITVSSTLATTTLSIIGIGSGVTIDGNLSRVDDGIFFNHVTSSVVSNLTVRNASSSHILAYSIDRVIGRHGGRTYDDDSTGSSFGSPASTTVIFAFGEHGPEPVGYGTNGYDVTSIVNGPHADGTWNDWQLALVDDGGTKLTLLIPGGLVDPSSPDLAGALSSGLGVTVDAFATSTFIYNAGDQSFTFNPSALTAAGITLASYVPAAPALTSTIGIATAGIRLDDAHGIAFSSVTSTNNGNGIRFGADSGGNTVTDSSFSSNIRNDVLHETALHNTFSNVSFMRASSTFSSTGDLAVSERVRARTTLYATGAPIQAVTVTSTAANATVTSFGQTNASGYTGYQLVPVYTLSAADHSATAGGFNPYLFAAATSTLFVETLSHIIDENASTVSIAMFAPPGPTAPSGLTVSTIGTSTAMVVWTDNSNDELSFLFDVRRPLLGESFPGMHTVLSNNATTSSLSSLTPNQSYEVRVAAANGHATSSYATYTFTTLAVPPSAPTVTALSQTSISLTVNAVENTTSTTYAIYNQTNSAYVNGSGESSVTPVWQMTSTWNTTPVTGLTCGTNYTFVTIGRNADLISTATSTGASAITSACSVVSSGSGGGGGGGGGGGYYIPIPVSAVTSTSSGNPAASSTSPVPSSTSTLPLPQEIATPIVPLDRPPVEAKPGMEAEVCPIDDVVILTACLHVSRDLKTEDRTLVHIKEDLVRMKIPATPFQAQRLANFMAYGDSWWTIRLGEGERRAVLVDALDTMIVKPPLTVKGDVTLKITAIDLDRITRGLIPHYRNLPAEQQRATRTLQTFLTLFNHSPNFSDVKDDLRWNVLIYRLRFVRDLPSERAGADLYRRMFRKNPSDSFQWSVVRVLGYVK